MWPRLKLLGGIPGRWWANCTATALEKRGPASPAPGHACLSSPSHQLWYLSDSSTNNLTNTADRKEFTFYRGRGAGHITEKRLTLYEDHSSSSSIVSDELMLHLQALVYHTLWSWHKAALILRKAALPFPRLTGSISTLHPLLCASRSTYTATRWSKIGKLIWLKNNSEGKALFFNCISSPTKQCMVELHIHLCQHKGWGSVGKEMSS